MEEALTTTLKAVKFASGEDLDAGRKEASGRARSIETASPGVGGGEEEMVEEREEKPIPGTARYYESTMREILERLP